MLYNLSVMEQIRLVFVELICIGIADVLCQLGPYPRVTFRFAFGKRCFLVMRMLGKNRAINLPVLLKETMQLRVFWIIDLAVLERADRVQFE